jgi:hypothetical protein
MATRFADDVREPPEEVARVAEGLARIVIEVRSSAPAARVVLVDYLTGLACARIDLDG